MTQMASIKDEDRYLSPRLPEVKTPTGTGGGGPSRQSSLGRRGSVEGRRSSYRSSTIEPMAYDELLTGLTGSSNVNSTDLDPAVLKRDVNILHERLSKIGRGLLNPRSQMMQYWDFATLSALFFTATVTPYEVCMMWEEQSFETLIESGMLPLFIANWIVNSIFIVDMGFNFFLPYKESIKKGGGTVKSHKRIARHYLCGWFPIDLISVIPFDNIMMGVDTSGIKNASIFSMIRMLRLLRLIKLARILRASRIFSRWENSIALSSANMELVKYTILITMVLHWFACTLGIVAQLMSPPRDDRLALAVEAEILYPRVMDAGQCYGCTPDAGNAPDSICRSPCLTVCEIELLAELEMPSSFYAEELAERVALLEANQNWVCRYSRAGKVRSPTWHGELWVAGLYVAMIQLGGGVGSIVPENFIEYLVFFVCMLVGSVLWAMVVGTICATLATGDPHTIAFKQNMDQLNYFLEDMQMPQELRIRVREYLRNTRELSKKASYNVLVEILSPALRSEIVLMMSQRTLEVVWYLQSIEKGALVELALRLARVGYAPREKIPSDRLNILMRGVAAKAGNILTPANYAKDGTRLDNLCTWGEDIIVTAPALRDRRPASALTFVEVATLSRAALDDVLSSYPDSRKIIQQAAIKIAMQRAIVVVSEYIKLSKNLKTPSAKTAPGSPELFHNIRARFVLGDEDDDEAPHGAEILQMMTGKPLRDVDGDQIDGLDGEGSPGRASPNRLSVTMGSPPRNVRGEILTSSSVPEASAEAIQAQLQVEAKKRAELAAEVSGIKNSLDEVLKLLKAQSLGVGARQV